MTISSRVRLKVPLINTTGAIPAGAAPAQLYLCMTAAPTFGNSERPPVNITCSEAARDAWGNVLMVFGSTGVIDPGTMDVPVDWAIDQTNVEALINAIERDIEVRDYVFEFPETLAFSTGAKLTYKGVCIGASTTMPILNAGEARLTKTLRFKLSGDRTITPPVVRT